MYKVPRRAPIGLSHESSTAEEELDVFPSSMVPTLSISLIRPVQRLCSGKFTDMFPLRSIPAKAYSPIKKDGAEMNGRYRQLLRHSDV